MIINNIITFLSSRGWEASETNDTYKIIPPDNFLFESDYAIYLPKTSNKVDIKPYTDNIINILSDLYELSKDDLTVILKDNNTVFRVRVYDDQTETGKISLNRFEELIERIRLILSDTASFVINKSINSTTFPNEAKKYINLCNFMQTEKGSFVAKIQLPSRELIVDDELFHRDEIYSEDINVKLHDVLEYVNNNIFEGDIEITEEYLIDNENLINVKLLKNIKNLFEKAKIKNIEFGFHSLEYSEQINNQNITKRKIYKLTKFVSQVEAQFFDVGDFRFTGQIIELKSKNPEGSKNNVILDGLYDNMPMTVSAFLDSDQYKDALEAHKIKQSIEITGIAKRTKSKARFLDITNFLIQE